MSTRLAHNVRPVRDERDTYLIVADRDRCGTTFTNRNTDAEIWFGLPHPKQALLGVWYEFVAVRDSGLLVMVMGPNELQFTGIDYNFNRDKLLLGANMPACDFISVMSSNTPLGSRMRAECVQKTAGQYVWFASGVAAGYIYTLDSWPPVAGAKPGHQE